MSRCTIVTCVCSSRLPKDVVPKSSQDVFEKRRCFESNMFLYKQCRGEASCIVPKVKKSRGWGDVSRENGSHVPDGCSQRSGAYSHPAYTLIRHTQYLPVLTKSCL